VRRFRCPHCGQPSVIYRVGRRLTPLKARIFDAVKRAGKGGIDADDLFGLIFTEQHSRHTLKSHIWQINDLLEDTGTTIHGTMGTGSRYILRSARKAGNSRT